MKSPTGFNAAFAFFAVVILSSFSLAAKPSSATYDLEHTDGMENFAGSTNAREILAREGFVVTAPEFDKISKSYIDSPLPVFITVDSVWHTYHFLLEQGEKELEQSQIDRLTQFSRLLLRAAESTPGFEAIADYASIGLALQDTTYRSTLIPGQRRIVEGLLSGSAPVDAPIGFPLSPAVFQAQGFYKQSPELSRLYAAWQWYATVDFRVSNRRETDLAIRLSRLIENNPELLTLWKRLNDPYDALIGFPDDGTVATYARIDTQGGDLQKKLLAMPRRPRPTDQILSPSEYSPYSSLIAGFRLFPARQVPDGICLRECVAPSIPKRVCPSGLDFMVASKVMRSAAALRASEALFGKYITKAVRKNEPGPMPHSVYGESLELFAELQKPLSSQAPALFHSDAWADLQLWTQLGAWAELRHMESSRPEPEREKAGNAKPAPGGFVEPYPDFFAGLAKLSRQTAEALDLDAKSNLPSELEEMARICDHLSILANGELEGNPLAPADARWMSEFGTALARLNPAGAANVSRIFDISGTSYVLNVGVARAQALYVILPLNGRPQLYRGAVLSYREFVGFKKVTLDDRGWQQIIRAKRTPAPPAFTASFLRAN